MIEKEIIQKLILFNIDAKDVEVATSIFGKQNTEDRVKALQDLDIDSLNINKTLLIMSYLHLYASLHLKDVTTDSQLTKLRSLLNISDDFTKAYSLALTQLDMTRVLNGRSALEAIVEPVDEVSFWITNLVYLLMNEGSYIQKKVLHNLDNNIYEHPSDKEALDTLEGTPGLEFLVRKFNEYGLERLSKINYTGSNIKVTETNFPQVYKALAVVCTTLDVSPMPDLYIKTEFINAWTMGVEKPIIVLASGCIGLLTYDELLFILGHEVGHIKSQHILYHQMADTLPILSDLLGSVTLGIGNLLSVGLEIALLNWYRKSEFTADRAGLLACQNIDAASTAMMKLAGAPVKYYSSLDPEEFRKQAKEFEGFDEDNLDKVAKVVSVMFSDHPWTVMRGHELYKWIDSGEYDSIMKGKITYKSLSSSVGFVDSFCTNCGFKLRDNMLFCTECGQKRN